MAAARAKRRTKRAGLRECRGQVILDGQTGQRRARYGRAGQCKVDSRTGKEKEQDTERRVGGMLRGRAQDKR